MDAKRSGIFGKVQMGWNCLVHLVWVLDMRAGGFHGSLSQEYKVRMA